MKIILVSALLLSVVLFRFSSKALESTFFSTTEPIRATKLTQPITFDGIPDDEAWHEIKDLPLVTIMPAFGKEPSEISVIKIAWANGLINNDIHRFTPSLPYSTGRTILLKYTYTFKL